MTTALQKMDVWSACQIGDVDMYEGVVSQLLNAKLKEESIRRRTQIGAKYEPLSTESESGSIITPGAMELVNDDLKDKVQLFAKWRKEIVNYAQSGGTTPLHYAACMGNLDLVRHLVGQGATPNIQNDAGFTPLMWAVEKNHAEVAQELLGIGEDPYIKNRYGHDCYYYAKGTEVRRVLPGISVEVEIDEQDPILQDHKITKTRSPSPPKKTKKKT